MNKILIGLILVIAGYLAYDSLSTEEGSTATINTTLVNTQDNVQETPVAEKEIILKSLNSIVGLYRLQITSNKGNKITEQALNIKSDNTFEMRRFTLKSDGNNVDETTKGNFSYDKNTLILTFSEDRNMDVFPEGEIKLTVKNNGNINYNSFEFIKE